MTKNLAGLNKTKKKKATPPAQDIGDYFAAKMNLPNEKEKVVPSLSDEDPKIKLKRFRVTKRTVRKVLKSLDESKAIGMDGVSPRVLKMCYKELTNILTRLFQKVSRTGKFPKH